MNLASSLRCELIARAQQYAQSQRLPHCLSYGENPVVCFEPQVDRSRHGNFHSESFKAISSNIDWMRRLSKVHPHGKRSLPRVDRGRWMELDSCVSSDALLMNVFCHPRALRSGRTLAVLGAENGSEICFGYKARVPLQNGKTDRTEVDLRLGSLLIEAKLTETDFQRAEKKVLAKYRDFRDVFLEEGLPQTATHYLSYQLLRNVLAAYASRCAFCVLLDARRRDLIEDWYAVMSCVKPIELRTGLSVLTWQELAGTLPIGLKTFLFEKYGIEA